MRYAILIASILTLGGCASWTKSTVATADAACKVWPTTPYSKNDTKETIEGNRLNNARREGWCEGR